MCAMLNRYNALSIGCKTSDVDNPDSRPQNTSRKGDDSISSLSSIVDFFLFDMLQSFVRKNLETE